MFWQYKILLFGNYDKALFASIEPDQQCKPTDNKDPKFAESLREFRDNLKEYAKKCAQESTPQKIPGIPRLPFLLYIITPSARSGLRVHLACPDFCRETGFTVHSLHDASREAQEDNSDANIKDIVTELRNA